MMRHVGYKLVRSRILFVAAAVLLAAPASRSALAQEPATVAASTAESQPAMSFAETLALTDDEKTVLSVIRDWSAQLDEAGFYVMLNKAWRISQTTDQDLTLVDRPAAKNLLKFPLRYRGWPIRARLRVYRTEKLTAGDGLTRTRYWPADRPVWKLDCLHADAKSPFAGSIVAFSPIEPKILGEADTIDADGTKFYRGGRQIDVGAIAYKVWLSKDDDGNERQFPVVLIWRLGEPAASERARPFQPFGGLKTSHIAVLMITLIMLYALIKRMVKRSRKRELSHQRPIIMPDETQPVDPLLKEAAEQYSKEKEHDDGVGQNRSD